LLKRRTITRQYTPLIIIIIITILAAPICMAACASGAETYYMPDDGTLHDCLAMMSGGDTLIYGTAFTREMLVPWITATDRLTALWKQIPQWHCLEIQ